MSSSSVTLTKFSSMATIDGAAMTWQFTKSLRKRTYGAEMQVRSKSNNKRNRFQLQPAYLYTPYQVNSFRVKV